ncbi:hypothetical protein SERLA73DRAFT_157125 [Serpula lacrymans var. lacrymans S7.3]|uniref:Uncharacterized protein n=1 Tax=Serpula lacrymans var. lacrymans (strain S7.3) TaxID=936435 RepID=F8QHJ1_SERL3|nr:hypothetical protein SERLA73DRAFT_157125 [Serpula lacrymans var. lacrymans S7.3]
MLEPPETSYKRVYFEVDESDILHGRLHKVEKQKQRERIYMSSKSVQADQTEMARVEASIAAALKEQENSPTEETNRKEAKARAECEGQLRLRLERMETEKACEMAALMQKLENIAKENEAKVLLLIVGGAIH